MLPKKILEPAYSYVQTVLRYRYGNNPNWLPERKCASVSYPRRPQAQLEFLAGGFAGRVPLKSQRDLFLSGRIGAVELNF